MCELFKVNKSIFILIGGIIASYAQADDQVDALYSRIVQKDSLALVELQRIADGNNAQALTELGFIYEYGISVPINLAQSINYFEQACQLGGNYGCYNARYFYQYGQGVAQDTDKAKVFADKMNKNQMSIDEDTIREAVEQIYSAKYAAAKDPAKRSQFIKTVSQLAGMGSAWQALIEQLGFSKADILHLAEFWAQDGDPEITYQVGHLYDFGFVEVENKEAVSTAWFRKAADLGQADAQNLIGSFYVQGVSGFKRDIQEAIKWYERAAKQGNSDAQVNLGEIYYLGQWVKGDYARAFALFEQAADVERYDPEHWHFGSPRAWHYLAWMYTQGQYVKTDCKKAADYFFRGQSSLGKKDNFLPTCEKDKRARAEAVARRDSDIPVLTLRQDRIFHAHKGDSYACELEFIANSDRIGEIANLRVTLNLKNKAGATLEQVIAFEPFGMNTLNVSLDGYEWNTFSDSMLQPMYQREFCDYGLTYSVTAVTGTVNGKDMDILKAGIFH